ncbi:MAG: sulfatase-like hydrolase/transferase [Myxococcales bacterium]|nr:sulfatase-like hydrolase/transferase [Myxococcales bacterium]
MVTLVIGGVLGGLLGQWNTPEAPVPPTAMPMPVPVPVPAPANAAPARATIEFGPARAKRAAGATDVVLVTIDTVRADYLDPWGTPTPTSPVLAALTRQGVKFDNAYATAGWTSPTMASLMTSTYPSEHGVVLAALAATEIGVRQIALSPDALTLAEILKGAGYDTFGVCTNMLLTAKLGFSQGFDEYVESANADMPFPRMAVRALGPRLRESGKSFLWVHYYDSHWPYAERAPWFGRYNQSRLRTSADMITDAATWAYRRDHGLSAGDPIPPAAVPSLANYQWQISFLPHQLFEDIRRIAGGDLGQRIVEEHVRFLSAAYRSELSAVDDDVGGLMRDLGIDDNTLVIVTADHGEELLDHGDIGHSMASLYQELIHVPLIVRLPGGRHAGTVVDTPVSLVDIVPSLLELLEIDAPEGLSGESFVRLLGGEAPAEPREIVAELTHEESGELRAVVRQPWKYIHHYRDDRGMLFNVAADPRERHDRAAEEPQRAAEMREWLLAWSARTKPRSAKESTVLLQPADLLRLRALGYVSD